MADKESGVTMERQESVNSQKSDTKTSDMTELIEKVIGTDLNSDQAPSSSDNINNKNIVDSNLQIASDGESRLLPLLQGILLNKASPYYATETGGDQSSGSVASSSNLHTDTSSLCHNNHNNNYGHEFLKIEDSGTESGEDFRLLAAGLKNTEGGGAEILGEVNAALSRLQSSIKDGKEINMDIDKRHSLLTLISKLRTELLGPEKPKAENNLINLEQSSSCSSTQSSSTNQVKAPSLNRQDSNGARFARRRNRQNRHTVGVSREELADARRLVEAMIIRDALRTLPPLEPEAPPKVMVASPLYSLQKQKSAASIAANAEPAVLLRPSQFVQKNVVVDESHNKTAKPFTFGGGLVPNNNKAKMFRHCISYEQPVKVNNNQTKDSEGFARRASVDMIDPENTPKVKFTNGFVKKTPDHVDSSSDEEEPKEDPKRVVPKSYHTVQNKVDAFTRHMSQTREASVEKTKPLKHTESCKYSTKKNRMRRSNTVDLQRTSHDIDTDDEMSDREDHDACHSDSTSGFRRGTIAPKVPQVKSIVPELKPQKESDEKFLALLKKQEQQKTTVPTWVSPIQKQQQQQQNWVHKFDNLKHAFETGQKPAAAFPPPKSNNTAMKFWKCAEQNKTVDRSTILPPSGKVKPWQPPQNKVLEGPKPEPAKALPKTKFPVDVLSHPKPVKKEEDLSGKFSHAPTSAFKPPSKKIQVPQEIFNPKPVEQEPKKIAPVSTGVVKQLAATGYKEAPFVPAPKPIEPSKNVVSSLVRKNSLPKQKEAPLPCHIPWNGRKKDGAVDMAASKFEVNTYQPKLNPKYLPPDYEPTFPAVKQVPVLEAPSVPAQFKRHSSVPRQLNIVPPNSLPLPLPPVVNVNVNNTYDPTKDTLPRFNDQFNVDTVPNTPDEKPFEPVYTITDYTPAAVSTYVDPLCPPVQQHHPPHLSRSDSLTNPEAEPLVLTCTNQVYQPPHVKPGIYEKHKPMSMSTPSVSSSVMITAEEMSDSESDDTDDEDFSSEGVQEFKAVSKVMAAPVSGTAVTVSRKTQDLETENNLAQSLQVSLQKIAKRTPDRDRKLTPNTTTSTNSMGGSTGSNRSSMGSSPYDNLSVHQAISHGGTDNYLQVPLPKVEVISPTTPPIYEYKQPPVMKYQPSAGYFTKPVTAPLTAYNNTSMTGYHPQPMPRQTQQVQPSSPYNRMNDLQRAKSSHYLSVPETSNQVNTQVKPIMQEKQKQIAAYFGSGPNSAFKPLPKTSPAVQFRPAPQPSTQYNKKPQPQSSINRGKSSYAKGIRSSGLSRSQTMPNVNDINLLDEGNVEDAFEQLINS